MDTKAKNLIAAALLPALALGMGGCANPTGSSGTTMHYNDGVITDIELVDIQKNKYNTSRSAIMGAAGGAILGQIIGGDTHDTLVGAAIGGAAGGIAAGLADQGTGMRLSVETDTGNVLVDYQYSCSFAQGTKIRMLNAEDGTQIQVYSESEGRYITAPINSPSDCSLSDLRRESPAKDAKKAEPVRPEGGTDEAGQQVESAAQEGGEEAAQEG